MEHSDSVCVQRIAGKGRGVIARKAIKKGALIERVPVLLIPINHFVGGLDNATLKTYLYIWDKKHVAVSLGYGTLYNHSYEPNARYIHGKDYLSYRALRDIEEGEEITINYNFIPSDRTPVSFDVK